MTKKEKNSVNEPLAEYGEPASFNQVWKMFQETDRMFKANEKERKALSEETEKKFQETDKKIDKLAKLYGGVSKNSRDMAEEFFRSGLEKRNTLFGMEYDQVGRLEKKTKKLQGEYDIVLYNGVYMVVIEVKFKLHPGDVEDFIGRKLPNFKVLFPEYKDRKIIGALAAMSVPKNSYAIAEENGLLVLSQSGENIEVLNPKDFTVSEF